MKLITDLKEANILLESYYGASFKIAFYDESHKKMAIRLSSPDLSNVLYIIAICCESMKGRFSFFNSFLFLSKKENELTNETESKLEDKANGFELTTSSGFVLAQGDLADFGYSFDDFIKKW